MADTPSEETREPQDTPSSNGEGFQNDGASILDSSADASNNAQDADPILPTTAASDDQHPTTAGGGGGGAGGESENEAINLLQSIVKKHDMFDQDKEDAEIAALVKVAMDEGAAVTPEAGGGGGGMGEERELTEEEKIMMQVKTMIRFLQENIPSPTLSQESEYSHAKVGEAGFDVRMRAEYENLYRLFITARRNNQGLVKKLRDMKSEIVSNATKVEAAMKLFQEDRVVIAGLKKELKKAWKIVEMSKDKEMKAKDAMLNLKSEVDTIKREAVKGGVAVYQTKPGGGGGGGGGGGMDMVQENLQLQMEVDAHVKDKQELAQKHHLALTDIRILNQEIKDLNGKIDTHVHEKQKAIHEMNLVNDLLQSKKSDQDRESRIRDKLETSLQEKAAVIDTKVAEMKEKKGEVKGLKEAINRLEMQVKDEKLKVEKEANEKLAVLARVMRMQAEIEEQKVKAEHAKRDAKAGGNPVDHELYKCKEEIKTLRRANDGLQKEAKQSEEAKMAAEIERDAAKSAKYSLTRETESMKHQMENSIKQIEMLTKERDAAQKNVVKAIGATQRQFNVVKLSDQAQRTLEHEIASFKEEAGKMRKVHTRIIYSLEKERDYHLTEFTKLEGQVTLQDEELQMKQMLLFDARKKISELERKRKEQTQMYETVRTDRNLYSKNLIECEDEITELKRKLKIMGHQIEQLKEEIAAKESEIAKGHFEHSKLEKAKEGLALQITKLQTQFEEAQAAIKHRLAEENKLRHVIDEGDAARSKLKKEYDSVVQARDVLCSQVIHRNEEITLLYEKIKIHISTLNKGELQYYERIEDIRVLKLEIKKLRREKALLQTETQNVDGLRNEIFKLHKDVLKERTRVKVLEEELESPMNIHRWRKLSGSDPTMFELITKMQALQKRLILKTEEVVEKETLLHHKDKLYMEVKNLLQRQPGPEVLEELRALKASIKTKVRECKSLASELNMYHSQVNEYKYEIQRMGQDYQDLKKKYYELKKKDRDDRLLRLRMEQAQVGYGVLNERSGLGMLAGKKEVAYSLMPPTKEVTLSTLPPLKAHVPAGPRFNGGGFNMGRSATAQTGDEKRPLSEAAI
ncbi:hypothetical protein HDU98_000952 [Podochytrium sp. JEL0797]|nr:hypothetical protein HDU98_000952 [Podochytrium sp. JEL0797]